MVFALDLSFVDQLILSLLDYAMKALSINSREELWGLQEIPLRSCGLSGRFGGIDREKVEKGRESKSLVVVKGNKSLTQ